MPSRGKQARAEPVAALYEQNRFHHCGSFIGLEDEMVTWVPLDIDRQPEPGGCLVWAGNRITD